MPGARERTAARPEDWQESNERTDLSASPTTTGDLAVGRSAALVVVALGAQRPGHGVARGRAAWHVGMAGPVVA